MPSKLNELLLQELSQRFQEISHGIFVDYTGLSAQESHELRGRLLKDALRLRVIRNRVGRAALQPKSGAGVGRLLKGPIAVIYGNDDPVAAAKIVLTCVKDSGKLQLRGGFVEGQALDPGQVEQLARMPSKQDLLAQILSAIMAPAASLLAGLEGLFRQLEVGGVARELSGLLEAYHQKLKDEGT